MGMKSTAQGTEPVTGDTMGGDGHCTGGRFVTCINIKSLLYTPNQYNILCQLFYLKKIVLIRVSTALPVNIAVIQIG